MAADKYLRNVNGRPVETFATQVSTGNTQGGKLLALGDDGYIDQSVLPAGIGSDTYVVAASEALLAGDFVNVYDNAGTPACRKADASNVNKEAHGYVLAAVSSGVNATIYTDDKNTNQSGLTAGAVFLSATTAGRATNTVPTGSNQLVQRLGLAYSATAVHVSIQMPIQLA